ncbi:MAG: hypothetical protein ABIW34_14090 [Ginsengibacter sp.]
MKKLSIVALFVISACSSSKQVSQTTSTVPTKIKSFCKPLSAKCCRVQGFMLAGF